MKMHIDGDTKHIQIDDLVRGDADWDASFVRGLRGRYPGYTVDFCYHNSEAPVDLLAEAGAIPLETCVETRLVRDRFRPAPDGGVVPVGEENFAVFKAIHDAKNPGMYWSGVRIGDNLSQWRIYRNGEDYVLMAMWGDVPEIFALEAESRNAGATLLSAAARSAFAAGAESILYMIDDGAEGSLEMAVSVGFSICGRYVAYRVVLPSPT